MADINKIRELIRENLRKNMTEGFADNAPAGADNDPNAPWRGDGDGLYVKDCNIDWEHQMFIIEFNNGSVTEATFDEAVNAFLQNHTGPEEELTDIEFLHRISNDRASIMSIGDTIATNRGII